MTNKYGPLLLIFTVVGIIGLTFVTVPGFEYMIGAATDTGDASTLGVLAWIFILWISTGFFIMLTLGGLFWTFVVTFGN